MINAHSLTSSLTNKKVDNLFQLNFVIRYCCFNIKSPTLSKVHYWLYQTIKFSNTFSSKGKYSIFQDVHYFKTKELKSFYNMFCNELRMNAFWDNEFLEKISKLLHEKHFEMVFCYQNCSDLEKSDWEKLLKFEPESREFSKFLRSLEQFIQTVKGQNNFW